MWMMHVWQCPFSLSETTEGTTSCPTPNNTTASPRVPVGSNKESGQGKGQGWSSIGERQWHRKQSRRQMDQQMVSFRCIPEDDRAAGHMQRESERDRRRNRDRHRQRGEKRTPIEELFLFFFSCGSSARSIITKGQQLLPLSPGCCGERGDVTLPE